MIVENVEVSEAIKLGMTHQAIHNQYSSKPIYGRSDIAEQLEAMGYYCDEFKISWIKK